MRNTQLRNQEIRVKRALRVRKKLRASGKPRLSVHKSNVHIRVQIIDDANHHTLCAVSTCSSELAQSEFNRKNKASARKLGEMIAELAKQKNIKEVVFDRGQFKYHGVLAAVADAAREGGLQF